QGHPASCREAVDQDAFTFPPAGDALAATLARGKKRHPRRHTPNASSRVLRPRPESALASRRACHRVASAATSDGWHSSIPIAAHGGHHPTGTRSSRHTTTYAICSEMAHAAFHDRAWVVPGERHPQTSAPLNHSRLQSVLPYCSPPFRENSRA